MTLAKVKVSFGVFPFFAEKFSDQGNCSYKNEGENANWQHVKSTSQLIYKRWLMYLCFLLSFHLIYDEGTFCT